MGWHGSRQSKHGGYGAGGHGKSGGGSGGHGLGSGWGRSGHDRREGFRGEQPPVGDRPRRTTDMVPGGAAPTIPAMPKFAIVAAVGIFLAWTLLAIAAYGLVDGLGGWLSANSGALLQGGKDVAGVVGVGKELVDKVDVQGTTSLVQQVLGAALVIARPAIVALWFLGALAIIAVPFALRRFGLFRRSGH